MHPVTRIIRLAAVAATGISLAACGSSSGSGKAAGSRTSAPSSSTSSTTSSTPPSATPTSSAPSAIPDAVTLVHEARAATKKAKSAHLSGSMIESNKTTKLDAKGTLDGSNQELVVDEGSGTATIRTVDKAYYIKADKTFWTANGGASAAGLLSGRWIKTTEDPSGDFSGMTIGALLEEALSPQSIPDSDLKNDTTTRRTTYDGQPAYLITQTSTGDTITISATTKYVLQLKAGSAEDSKGSFTISGWDQQPLLTAPAGAIKLPAGA